MKLYTVPLAPNPMRVTLYVAEREALGCEFDIERITVNTLKGRQREPEHLARNSWGTLPVLELNSGQFITESLAIIHYLENAISGPSLLPDQAEERALARNLERIIEMRIALDMGQYVHCQKSPLGHAPDLPRAQELAQRIQLGLDYVETLLGDGRQFVEGPNPGVSDCTLAAFLQFMRFTETDLIGEREALCGWDQMYRERDAVKSLFML
ncbi:MAG: glutathione S-transferase family protein [Luminiphilus sp.]|nr:glutathione S-transferase family protein [Luminiphilus sp.]